MQFDHSYRDGEKQLEYLLLFTGDDVPNITCIYYEAYLTIDLMDFVI